MASTAPLAFNCGVTGNQIQQAGLADHTGWRLQAQTNAIGAGLGTNWFDVTGADATNLIFIPVDVNNGCFFSD